MKVVIAGGSGFLGRALSRSLSGSGHEVVVLSRTPDPGAPWRTAAWDAATPGPWIAEIDGADAVINLAGRTVNCRYSAAHRRQIIDSRTESTRVIGEAIARAARPPAAWLQAATATIYAHRYDAANDEAAGIIPDAEADAPETWRFSTGVARTWEKALDDANVPRTRKVALRIGIVMGPEPGTAFDVLLGLVRRGLGGRAGDGRQFVSWIHEDDFVGAIGWLIGHPDLSGPVNIVSPGPVPNAVFMRELRRAWGARFGLPAARWMLEVGAFFLRTETELVLKSRRVIPGRLLDSGFVFKHPAWPDAADDLCAGWRRRKGWAGTVRPM
jgi:uncharacterized protein (TIGR01777 family)